MEYFEPLYKNDKYRHAMIYAAAHTRGGLENLKNIFKEDVENVLRRKGSTIQFSSHAIGIAYRKDIDYKVNKKEEEKIVKMLCDIILSKNMNKEELICSMIALGWICDQRKYPDRLSSKAIKKAYDVMSEVEWIYSPVIVMETESVRNMVVKMINGDILSASEEEFLLTKLDI